MNKKKIGYFISKGKCVKAYSMVKINKKTGKKSVKKVNYSGKKIKKGTKIFKRKSDCLKRLRKAKKGKKTRRSPKRTRRTRRSPKRTRRKSKFGNKSCYYEVPYFGTMVPSIGKSWSGIPPSITSSAWKWPTPPGAGTIDEQQGRWHKY